MALLEDVMQGDRIANPQQIKSAEILLDRLVPRLAAVEETHVNELDALDREAILSRIQALLAADPTLLPELIALDAKQQASVPASVSLLKPSAR